MHNSYHYHSNGNLLLTGEYLISDGAEAIALPLRKGHTLAVKPIHGKKIIWESVYNQKTETKVIFRSDDFQIIQTDNENSANFIQQVLRKAMDHLPSLNQLPGYHIKAFHDYPAFLEFGCESAMIANIADWFNINPFRFSRDISPGLESQIACAKNHKPILFKATNKFPDYQEINLNFPFAEHLHFIYTGNKDDSSDRTKQLHNYPYFHEILIKISEINNQIIQSSSLEAFEKALLNHDKLLSEVLNEKRLQEKAFRNFPGIVKPLNDWSGKFVLASWKGKNNELREYFGSYNIQTIFSWEELIKNVK